MSQEQLFTPDDYAELEVGGRYIDKMGTMSQDGVVTHEFNRAPDNRIRWTVTSLVEAGNPNQPPVETTETDWLALIEIPDAPTGWYLAMAFKASGEPEPFYYLVSHDEEGAFRWHNPSCMGTETREGMAVLSENTGTQSSFCDFTSREALFSAAREAVDFLTDSHPVQIVPVAYFIPAPTY